MDQNEAPILDALAEYHRLDRYGYTPPGHRQGRGADPGPSRSWARTPFAPMSSPPPVSMTGNHPAAT